MDIQTLKLLVNAGRSTYEIAKETGKGQTTVRYWLSKYGLKTRPYQEGYKCKNCSETNPANMMNKGGGRRSKNWCKKCHSRFTVERFREKKKKCLEYKGGKCENCGYNKCRDALEFHHLDPKQKDKDFVHIKSWGWDRVKKELDKCIILCSNCHREKHAGL